MWCREPVRPKLVRTTKPRPKAGLFFLCAVQTEGPTHEHGVYPYVCPHAAIEEVTSEADWARAPPAPSLGVPPWHALCSFSTLSFAGLGRRPELMRRLQWKRESIDRLFRLEHASRLDQTGGTENRQSSDQGAGVRKVGARARASEKAPGFAPGLFRLARRVFRLVFVDFDQSVAHRDGHPVAPFREARF
jgi:hypothetical protein